MTDPAATETPTPPDGREGPPADVRPRRRLAPEERRSQLVVAANKLLNVHGVDKLLFTELATTAGVTRPVVYKFFPNKQSLLIGVMEDFEEEMTRRFVEEGQRQEVRQQPARQKEMIRRYIMAACDTIESRGSGAWHLLDSRGPDSELEAAGLAIQRRLLKPWREQLLRATGATFAREVEVETLTRMMLAAGRVTLNQWLNGNLTREEAIHYTSLGIGALLKGFTASTGEMR